MRAPTLRFALDDTTVQLRAPRHRSDFKSRDEDVLHPARRYNLAAQTFRPMQRNLAVDRWHNLDLVFRSWSFYGPWFTGRLAEMSMYIGLLTPTQPQAGVSLFHPRAFENAVADYLTDQFAPDKRDGKSLWAAPVNWQVLHSLPSVAARLVVMPDQQKNRTSDFEEYVFFPIADRYMVKLIFTPVLSINASLEESRKQIDHMPMETLMNDIINSLQVTLSPAALAQQAAALSDLEDTSLTEHFAPLKWTTEKEDAEWAQHQRNEAESREHLAQARRGNRK